jgi:hypothetical protein
MRSTASIVKLRLSQLPFQALAARNSYDPLGNLIIFSDPRGGSTWITELFSTIPETAILWEPLHLASGAKVFRTLNFHWRQYTPETTDWYEAQVAFDHLLRGKLLNQWICSRSSYLAFYHARRLVVKFCRANALVPWITRQFPFRYKPVLLLRHPFAVVASQLQYGSWNYQFTGFKVPDMPFPDLYMAHESYLRKLTTKEEALTATWCITNLVPLRHKHNNERWITVFYEDLLLHPERELRRIFDQWKITMPEHILSRVDKPSTTTKEATFSRGAASQLEKWQNDLSENQIKRMTAVLEYFKVEVYDGQNVLPLAADR